MHALEHEYDVTHTHNHTKVTCVHTGRDSYEAVVWDGADKVVCGGTGVLMIFGVRRKGVSAKFSACVDVGRLGGVVRVAAGGQRVVTQHNTNEVYSWGDGGRDHVDLPGKSRKIVVAPSGQTIVTSSGYVISLGGTSGAVCGIPEFTKREMLDLAVFPPPVEGSVYYNLDPAAATSRSACSLLLVTITDDELGVWGVHDGNLSVGRGSRRNCRMLEKMTEAKKLVEFKAVGGRKYRKVAASENGRMVYTAVTTPQGGHAIRTYSIKDPQDTDGPVKMTIEYHKERVLSTPPTHLATTPSHLVYSTSTGAVHLLDGVTLHPLWTTTPTPHPITSLSCAPSRHHTIACTSNGELHILHPTPTGSWLTPTTWFIIISAGLLILLRMYELRIVK